MYVRLMSNTMDVPERHAAASCDPGLDRRFLDEGGFPCTFEFVVQVVDVGDEAVVGKQEAHPGQQHRKVDAMVTVVGDRLLKV